MLSTVSSPYENPVPTGWSIYNTAQMINRREFLAVVILTIANVVPAIHQVKLPFSTALHKTLPIWVQRGRCTVRVHMAGTVLWDEHRCDVCSFNNTTSLPWNRPIMDEQPGPPFSLYRKISAKANEQLYNNYHSVKGAVSGLFRASKNQNHCSNDINN